ncbi:hypothetical protein TNCV_225711 [Trichonephila clavipes]|nr:hypothetical protein TNCV_225711 [Trichonephila clavipes]
MTYQPRSDALTTRLTRPPKYYLFMLFRVELFFAFQFSFEFFDVSCRRSHGRDLMAGLVESGVRVLEPLKIHCSEMLMHVESVGAHTPSIGCCGSC